MFERGPAEKSQGSADAGAGAAGAGPGKRSLTDGMDPQTQEAAAQLRSADGRSGPKIPITPDLVNLFSPQAPKQPSLPGRIKDPQWTEIKGRAFVQGAGDADEVNENDVHQGQLGDCGLHAAMIAIARTNPAAIKKLISGPKPDGTYDVTLYFKDWFWQDKSPHVINVKPIFPTDKSGNPLLSQKGDVGPDGPELWAMLIEKAFAQHKGGYDSAEGVWDKDALDLMTDSKDVTEENVTSKSETEMGKAIGAKLSSGNYAVTANTSQSRWNEWWRSKEDNAEIQNLGIVMTHAYTVVAVDEAAKTISLKNPWGFQDLNNLPFATFRKYFHSWSAAKVK
jgi:hypothetical protein